MAHHYGDALQQCKLGIKQGGKLTQAALIAPASNMWPCETSSADTQIKQKNGEIMPFTTPTGSPLFQLPPKP